MPEDQVFEYEEMAEYVSVVLDVFESSQKGHSEQEK